MDDPFAHLEGDGPEVRRWQAALDAEAREALRSLPRYREVLAEVTRYLAVSASGPPVRGGGAWFAIEHDAVTAAPALGGPARSLICAQELVSGTHPGVDGIWPSPDATWVAVAASSGGDERTVLCLVEAKSGAVTARVRGASDAVWLPDSRALYCLADRMPLYVEPTGLTRPVAAPQSAARRRSLQLSPDGRYLALLDQPVAPRLTHVRDGERWITVASVPDGTTLSGAFLGDEYYGVTTLGAPRGRVVAAPVGGLENGTWREVVPERPGVLRALAVVGGELLLCYFERGASRLVLASPAGVMIDDVRLPGEGLCSIDPRAAQYGAIPPVRTDRQGFTFSFSTVSRSPALLRYDAGQRTLQTVRASALVLESVRSHPSRCVAPDGAEVDYDVVRRDDACRPAPAVIVAYGGWNAMTRARGFPAEFAPFLDAGGALVFAHVRGDATFGADRWHGGRRRRKQRSFDDVLAVADDLRARGVADRLGLWGASNGGLLVGAAITQRPELFRAAVAVVPLLDMCRFVREPFGEHAAWEYGDPRDSEHAAWLRAYSPYHHVQAGTRYPALLVVCGANDVRAHPWHGRKLVARLRSAGQPALLRVHAARGHVTTSDHAAPSVVAEWLTFLMHHLLR